MQCSRFFNLFCTEAQRPLTLICRRFVVRRAYNKPETNKKKFTTKDRWFRPAGYTAFGNMSRSCRQYEQSSTKYDQSSNKPKSIQWSSCQTQRRLRTTHEDNAFSVDVLCFISSFARDIYVDDETAKFFSWPSDIDRIMLTSVCLSVRPPSRRLTTLNSKGTGYLFGSRKNNLAAIYPVVA